MRTLSKTKGENRFRNVFKNLFNIISLLPKYEVCSREKTRSEFGSNGLYWFDGRVAMASVVTIMLSGFINPRVAHVGF